MSCCSFDQGGGECFSILFYFHCFQFCLFWSSFDFWIRISLIFLAMVAWCTRALIDVLGVSILSRVRCLYFLCDCSSARLIEEERRRERDIVSPLYFLSRFF